jgi:hypothetical protein
MQQFHPGEKAVFAGVYKVVHDSNHEPPHYVTVLSGDTFPSMHWLRQACAI